MTSFVTVDTKSCADHKYNVVALLQRQRNLTDLKLSQTEHCLSTVEKVGWSGCERQQSKWTGFLPALHVSLHLALINSYRLLATTQILRAVELAPGQRTKIYLFIRCSSPAACSFQQLVQALGTHTHTHSAVGTTHTGTGRNPHADTRARLNSAVVV